MKCVCLCARAADVSVPPPKSAFSFLFVGEIVGKVGKGGSFRVVGPLFSQFGVKPPGHAPLPFDGRGSLRFEDVKPFFP